ncbi:hypothetical protein AB0442_08150 [Kitasatospora sp. NPDC085895]|uniref:DUF7617 domain-containing protein n=1 Tax=Kitasatospora sp. NPDC085895 TaxID=3155057 RepID=UPI0034500066
MTVNDSVTPGCRQAAGTFALAAGTSRAVHCDSLLLALPLKNTASASFVPREPAARHRPHHHRALLGGGLLPALHPRGTRQ